jgi:hypothetical protein
MTKGDLPMKIKSMPAMLIFAAALSTAGIGNAQSLNFRTVAVPNSQETVLAGLNNSNVAVGLYIDSTGVQHGMAINGRTVTNVDDPNGVGTTVCEGINNSGVIVGFYVNSGGTQVGFVERNGNFADVLPLGSTSSTVDTINDNGVFAGTYLDASGVNLAFYGPANNFTSVSVPTSTATLSAVNNNAGAIVITWTDPSGNIEASAYNATNGNFTTVNVPSASDSFADFINNHNQIVYAWEDSSGNFHGAVRSASGQFVTFDDPDGTNTEPSAINDLGIIDGAFTPTGASAPQGFAAARQ